MAWWWWFGGFALVIVGVKPVRRTVSRELAKVIRRKAQRRPRTTQRRPPSKKVVRAAARKPQKSPWKPVQPIVQPGAKQSKPLSVLRPQRCSVACRQSRKPASTCDCACRGRDHGRYRPGTAAAIRATKYTPAQRKAQRTAVMDKREQDANEARKRRQAKQASSGGRQS